MAEQTHAAIAAVIYGEGAYPDQIFHQLARDLQAQGFSLGGTIQRDHSRPGRSRCDMSLEELTTGTIIGLSEDRGKDARGCRIDQNGLMQAAALITKSLEQETLDLLIINKFGKVESEGGGLRSVIGEAVAREIPLLVGVSHRNLDAWNAFAGSYCQRIAPERAAVESWVKAKLSIKDTPSSTRSAKIAARNTAKAW
jgi:nucleoside-triphosphatase THEP1